MGLHVRSSTKVVSLPTAVNEPTAFRGNTQLSFWPPTTNIHTIFLLKSTFRSHMKLRYFQMLTKLNVGRQKRPILNVMNLPEFQQTGACENIVRSQYLLSFISHEIMWVVVLHTPLKTNTCQLKSLTKLSNGWTPTCVIFSIMNPVPCNRRKTEKGPKKDSPESELETKDTDHHLFFYHCVNVPIVGIIILIQTCHVFCRMDFNCCWSTCCKQGSP